MLENSIKNLRNLIDGMSGHNYALPDCIKYIFERIGDFDSLDFWDFAAITGDTVAQVYNHNLTTYCEYCVSGFLADEDYIADIFNTLGYNHEYASACKIASDISAYTEKIKEYIDKGIPVLVKTNIKDVPLWISDVGTYCLIIGYEKDASIIKLLINDKNVINYDIYDNKLDLIFIGSKQKEISTEEIYLKAIKKMPYWLELPERKGMYFGAAAYKKWADDIESGRFCEANIDLWGNYGVYVCNLATSGGVPTYIFEKLSKMNEAYSRLEDYGRKIQELLPAETPTGGRSKLWLRLEELGGAMDMEAVKIAMSDESKRIKIAEALRNYSERLEKALELMKQCENLL